MQLMEKFLFKIAKKWIAGDTIDDALSSAKNAYQMGRHAIINKLGEYHTTKKQIRNSVDDYQKIANSFRKWKIRGAISVKPTQIGLTISQKQCYQKFRRKLFRRCVMPMCLFGLIWSHQSILIKTIELYSSFFSKYERLGIALQANLKRTEDDLNHLIGIGAKIRLVKGAYREKSNISFRTREDVDKNYIKLMTILFKKGNEFAIASHDNNIIKKAEALSKKYPRKFEFEFLKGIREEIKQDLVKNGFISFRFIFHMEQIGLHILLEELKKERETFCYLEVL